MTGQDTQSGLRVVPMRLEHWPAVRQITREGLATGNATFETSVPQADAFAASHVPQSALVALRAGEAVGWAALSPVSTRCTASGVAEASVYVGAAHRRSGVGRALLVALTQLAGGLGIWTIEGRVMAENRASMRLLEAAGFRRVGVRERIGRLDGVWRDIVLFELRLPDAAVAGLDAPGCPSSKSERDDSAS